METQYSENPAMFRNKPFGFILSLALVPVGIGILILLVWFLKCKATRLEFTGNSLILEQGLLSKDRTELNAGKIRSVNVYQSFINRIFGVGRISIYTAGDIPEIEVAGMPRPHDFRDLINMQQDA